MTQNLNSIAKPTHGFFEISTFLFHPRSSDNSRKCHYFFFFENDCITISSSSSSSIYNIVIGFNTPTTMNNQFEAFNASKINIYIFIYLFLTHTNYFPFTFSLITSQNPNFLILKFINLLMLLKFMILGQEQVCNFH